MKTKSHNVFIYADGKANFFELVTFLDYNVHEFGCFPGEAFAEYLMPAFEMGLDTEHNIKIEDLREDWQPMIQKYCPQFGEITWRVSQ